mmetsp:Transcript_24059/g.78308  ORF Transcript_24059/g.78308 Transcript_24059/m.78308 type:complete len:458 (-) Transcript_24059:391-1764(-)
MRCRLRPRERSSFAASASSARRRRHWREAGVSAREKLGHGVHAELHGEELLRVRATRDGAARKLLPELNLKLGLLLERVWVRQPERVRYFEPERGCAGERLGVGTGRGEEANDQPPEPRSAVLGRLAPHLHLRVQVPHVRGEVHRVVPPALAVEPHKVLVREAHQPQPFVAPRQNRHAEHILRLQARPRHLRPHLRRRSAKPARELNPGAVGVAAKCGCSARPHPRERPAPVGRPRAVRVVVVLLRHAELAPALNQEREDQVRAHLWLLAHRRRRREPQLHNRALVRDAHVGGLRLAEPRPRLGRRSSRRFCLAQKQSLIAAATAASASAAATAVIEKDEHALDVRRGRAARAHEARRRRSHAPRRSQPVAQLAIHVHHVQRIVHQHMRLPRALARRVRERSDAHPALVRGAEDEGGHLRAVRRLVRAPSRRGEHQPRTPPIGRVAGRHKRAPANRL